MGKIEIIVEQSFGSQVIYRQTRSITIAPLNVGKRQMLEATESTSINATGNIVLTDDSNVIQIIDPNGTSRQITLPAEAMTNHGFLIFNTADVSTELLTIKNDAGDTIAIMAPGLKAGWFISDGTQWVSAGDGGYDLDNLDDVVTSGVIHNALLAYDSADQLWKPSSNIWPHQYHGAITAFRWYHSGDTQFEPTIRSITYGSYYSGHFAQSTAEESADGDYVKAQIPLAIGTYKVKLSYAKGGAFGKFQMSIDGVDKGALTDAYGGSGSDNNELTLADITVLTNGIHDIRFTINGRNASNTIGYRFGASDLIMFRTS